MESQSSRLILSLRWRGWAVKFLSPSAAFVRSSALGAAERSRACAGAHTLRGGSRWMPSTRSGAKGSPGVGGAEDAAQLLEEAAAELSSEIAARKVVEERDTASR